MTKLLSNEMLKPYISKETSFKLVLILEYDPNGCRCMDEDTWICSCQSNLNNNRTFLGFKIAVASRYDKFFPILTVSLLQTWSRAVSKHRVSIAIGLLISFGYN